MTYMTKYITTIDRNVAIKFAIIILFLTITFQFKVVLPADFHQQQGKTLTSQQQKTYT